MLAEDVLKEIARELTVHTGIEWSVVHMPATSRKVELWELRTEDGRAIRLHTVWGRLSWGGIYGVTRKGTRPYFNDDSADSITTSADRAPRAIAADIARRLLPGYTERFAHAQQQINAEDARQERIAEETAQLIEVGASIPDQYRSDSICYVTIGSMSGGIVPIGDGTVNVDLHHVPIAEVAALIRAVRETVKKEEQS